MLTTLLTKASLNQGGQGFTYTSLDYRICYVLHILFGKLHYIPNYLNQPLEYSISNLAQYQTIPEMEEIITDDFLTHKLRTELEYIARTYPTNLWSSKFSELYPKLMFSKYQYGQATPISSDTDLIECIGECFQGFDCNKFQQVSQGTSSSIVKKVTLEGAYSIEYKDVTVFADNNHLLTDRLALCLSNCGILMPPSRLQKRLGFG